jgi:hypothetical protein
VVSWGARPPDPPGSASPSYGLSELERSFKKGFNGREADNI